MKTAVSKVWTGACWVDAMLKTHAKVVEYKDGKSVYDILKPLEPYIAGTIQKPLTVQNPRAVNKTTIASDGIHIGTETSEVHYGKDFIINKYGEAETVYGLPEEGGTLVTEGKARTLAQEEIAKYDFIKIVEALPDEGLPNRIYLVPHEAEEGSKDLFDMWLWISDAWEFEGTKSAEIDNTLYVKNTDISTTPTANKIPKYNQFGQLIVNCTEAAPGSDGGPYTQYTGEAVPRALWRAYVDNFHSKIIANKGDINTLASKLSSKKIIFNYYDSTDKAVLKKNCLYLVIDHSGGNDAHMYITDSSGVDRVATTQGDSAVESLPSFRLALIITTEDFHHTMVIGQTGKFSLTNFSPLYTKQVIWDNSNREMFIKTSGTGMSVWEIQV